MSSICWLVARVALCLMLPKLLEASYQCGIRKHSFVQLVHDGWTVEEGQWPWHSAIFHKQPTGPDKYACGGSLLDEKHVLTAAHCAVNRKTKYALPASLFELHFGQQNLSSVTGHVQIRDVSRVHVHPDHSTHQNDVALLVLRLPVRFTDYVIPICLDQKADIDLRNLEGERGWIAGWGTTQTGSISDVLRTASLPVVSYLECLKDHPLVFANLLSPNVFCAGDRNGTSPGTGDSGGGMYFSDGDQWVLRGIVSFAKADEKKKEVDTCKYTVFVNVQRFLTWIREVMVENGPQVAKGPKRISERECDRFKGLARKRKNNICDNSRYPHTVSIVDSTDEDICNGVLIDENHVLTICQCTRAYKSGVRPAKVRIDVYGSVGISDFVCHPQYQAGLSYHDLAVVKLNASVHVASNIIPACLASNETENLYDTLLQTGYGDTIYGLERKFIESEENRVIANEICNKKIKNSVEKLPNGTVRGQLCVKNTDQLRTSTWGSTGGPLQSVNTRTCMHTVVGIYSSAILGYEVYTRISHYLDWIEQVVWNAKPPVATTIQRIPRTSTPRN